MLDWQLHWIVSMRSMNHASGNGLLLLEVVLLDLALGDLGHKLEVHEAALGVGVGLGGHEGHCFLVVIEVRVLSVLGAFFDRSLVGLHALEAFQVLVVLPLSVGVAVMV